MKILGFEYTEFLVTWKECRSRQRCLNDNMLDGIKKARRDSIRIDRGIPFLNLNKMCSLPC